MAGYREQYCEYCKCGFFSFGKKPPKYCSDACRQAAYRRRVNPQVGSFIRRIEGKDKEIETKRRKSKVVVCSQCGREMTNISVKKTNLMYCTDACKQAAYRDRKRNVD